ncbi:MAG: hypothetical protein AAF394_17805, partial [Planctomycetota bacterium]
MIWPILANASPKLFHGSSLPTLLHALPAIPTRISAGNTVFVHLDDFAGLLGEVCRRVDRSHDTGIQL